MSLTRAEAEQIVKEALEQGWAEEANSERATEIGEGQVDMFANYGGAGWDRSQAADHHDWVDGVCSRCNASRDQRTEHMSCPGQWVQASADGTYHVELLFPGMYQSEKYWIVSTDDWRKLKAKVDELKEIIKQAVERGWVSGSFSRAPKKAGKLGMYVEIAPPGTLSYLPQRVGGMRTWRKLCREHDSVIDAAVPQRAIEPRSSS